METSRLFKQYLKMYGPHFTKKLCEFAVSLMEDEQGSITPITKEELDEKLKKQNMELKYNQLYDDVYVANMCKADYMGTAVPNDDLHLCWYVKRTIDDPDGYDGQVFNRWLSDVKGMNIHTDWSDFV